MKTQNEMRSEFERLEEIARMVACDDVKWCDVYNWYRTDNTDANSIYHISWLNGAWYAFQEKQKEIDAKNKKILYLLEDYKLRSDPFNMDVNSCINEMVSDLKELLK